MSGESLTMPDQIPLIQDYARGKKRLVEIGVCFGGTSARLRAVMAPDGELNLVDPFPEDLDQTWKGQPLRPNLKIAQDTVNAIPVGVVKWWITTSERAAKRFKGLADFVFIDGIHDESMVLLDWASWSPKVSAGGVVLLHDVANYCPGVLSAWRKIKTTPGWVASEKLEMGIMQKL